MAPAERAADAVDLVGDDGFTVAGTAEDNSPITLALRHGFRRRTDEDRVIDRSLVIRTEIPDVMPKTPEHRLDLFLVGKPGVVRRDGDLHGLLPSSCPDIRSA